jgi:hypothetical protein
VERSGIRQDASAASALDGVSGGPTLARIGERWSLALDCAAVDASYIGLVGALLGSAVTGLLALFLDRQRGSREREAAREQRDFERLERRYQDRLDVYESFLAETANWERELEAPGDGTEFIRMGKSSDHDPKPGGAAGGARN